MNFEPRLLVVDDDQLIRSLLEQSFKSLGFEVRTAKDSADARKVAHEFDPDVALLDVDLGPGPDGFDLANILKIACPGLALVFLTNIGDPQVMGKTSKNLPAGAAYLLKSKVRDPQHILEVLEAVTKGQGKKHRDDVQHPHPLKQLSRSQFEVIKLVAAGKSNEEIALIRATTVRAVRFIMIRAFAALGLKDGSGPERRVQAAIEYLKLSGIPE